MKFPVFFLLDVVLLMSRYFLHHDLSASDFDLGNLFCVFSDQLKHIEEKGMPYVRDSCGWDVHFVRGFDILRKLDLVYNKRFSHLQNKHET